MPIYNYICLSCESAFKKAHKREPDQDNEDEMALVVYGTKHPMNPTPEDLKEALVCPRCQSGKAVRTFYGSNIVCYTKWRGWKDKSGVKRDIDMHRLANNEDPYAQYRVPGEVEHLKKKIKNSGKRNPKTRYYTSKKNSDK